MLYNVLPDESDGLKGLPMIQAVRLCTNYAREIYENCRYAIYQKNEQKWIVPKDFGENDFFRIVGQAFNIEDKIDDALNVPDETCLDFTHWKELEAAHSAKAPAAILMVVMAVGAIAAFF
jgi:hypothetical protein